MKQAYISTAFWDDDWVGTLDPSEKLFYLYLITNSNNNIIGFYKLPKRKLCFDTGFSIETVNLLIARFESEYKKIIYLDDYVFLKNMVKNQALNSPKLIEGMRRLVIELNDKFKTLFLLEVCKQGIYSLFDTITIPITYPIDTLLIPYGYPMDMVCIPSGQNKYKQKHKTEIETKTEIEQQQTKKKPENENQQDVVVADEKVFVPDGSVAVFKRGMSQTQKRRPLELRDIPELLENWYFFRSILNEGIKPDKIIELNNQLPVIDIARLWYWAKKNATKNVAGYFFKIFDEIFDDPSEEIIEAVKEEMMSLYQKDPLLEERSWRKKNNPNIYKQREETA